MGQSAQSTIHNVSDVGARPDLIDCKLENPYGRELGAEGYKTGELGAHTVLSSAKENMSSTTSKRIGQLAEEMKELSRRDMEAAECNVQYYQS